MSFYDENNNKIDTSTIEIIEQQFAEKYISPLSIVLELGARYGTVSCVINKKLSCKSNQVSVEPDTRVWNSLENNILINDCSVNLVKGFISRTPRVLTNLDYWKGYGTTSILAEVSPIKNYTLEQIEEKYNLRFDTLVADCEGCLEELFNENPKLYNQLELIIMEADSSDSCNYNKLFQNLRLNLFSLIDSHVGYWFIWKKDTRVFQMELNTQLTINVLL